MAERHVRERVVQMWRSSASLFDRRPAAAQLVVGCLRACLLCSGLDASGTAEERALRQLINPDAGNGEWSAAIAGVDTGAAGSVVVEACLVGSELPCAQLGILVSADAQDSPLEVTCIQYVYKTRLWRWHILHDVYDMYTICI